MSKPPRSKLKFLVFSLIPAVVLFVGAEIAVRLSGLDATSIETRPLPEETAGLFRSDDDLFWALQPDLDLSYQGVRVTTNSMGLRAPEPAPRLPDEFRILSLGESSTFGIRVTNEQTYTDRLGALLGERYPSRTVTAFNAGVSAYSSFQSLRFLETRGLDLDPDLILFYHEVNDYLPSSLRDSSNNEVGVVKSDKQLHDSRVQRVHRLLTRNSALYRFFNLRSARRRIDRFNSEDFLNPVQEIGLPDIAIRPRLREGGDETELNEISLGRRVTEQEREEILERLVELAAAKQIALIVIHPTYASTRPHACVLTAFSERTGALMFESFDRLHPVGSEEREFFVDSMHPNAEGHRRLAEGLAEFVATNRLIDD